MQLSVNINDNSIAEKILCFLNSFSNKGVIVKKIEIENVNEKLFSDEYIEKNWREIGMNTHSSNLNDDERIYEAALEFYNEKHSS
jgi:hypothetical protein